MPVQDWPEGFSAGGKIRNAMQGEYGSLVQDRCGGLNQDHPRLAGRL
jgi:hypothetical protein